jgi:hypothetical protein
LVLERPQEEYEKQKAYFYIYNFYDSKEEAVKEINSLLQIKDYKDKEFFILKAEEVNSNEFYRTNKQL